MKPDSNSKVDPKFKRAPSLLTQPTHSPIPDEHGHFVRFYEDSEVLMRSVAEFIGAGLGAGEAAIVICTPPHREILEAKLLDHGLDVRAILERGQLLSLDAAGTLEKFMRRGLPDEDLFMQTIGSLIAKAGSERSGLRAFGEMVAILWADGNHEAAVALEELWNKLGKTLAFSLYCAYPIRGFKDQAHGKLFAHICREHSSVIPAESYLDSAPTGERLRTVAMLQQRASSLEAEIVERKRIESALSESEIRFRTMADSAPVMLWMTDAEGAATYVNRPWLEFTGHPWSAELDREPTDGIHHDDMEKTRQAFSQAMLTRTPFHIEYRYRRFDGVYRWILDAGTPRFSHDNVFLGFIGSAIDITGHKETEDQLRQAQKMEAIGRLAGGIAHDFNNLLTAINGYSEMALVLVEGNENLMDYLGEIKRSGERAASLTQQLLAYSRKQILAPTVFDLNETVADMDRMLRRLIGENIRMELALEPNLGLVRADPGQIQQIILNLVLNARDAMQGGGRLVFETANVILDKAQDPQVSRPHAMLAVRDTGTGMTAEVRSRIFEPFFTTKEVGKGTGLGLSSAYGIIRQSGGIINVESEPGRGSLFRIYLPIVEADRYNADVGNGRTPESARPSETILLVEDEDAVRTFIQRTLQSQGYTILEAKDGHAAIALGETCRHIDLLLTDVVMPDMNGAALADKLKALHPDIRVLFMSGYTDNIFLPGGVSDPASKFLQKPFGQADLHLKVRELLNQANPSRPG
ncbi:MAG: MEDS domain-containing protein [Fibrobacteria bacterium]